MKQNHEKSFDERYKEYQEDPVRKQFFQAMLTVVDGIDVDSLPPVKEPVDIDKTPELPEPYKTKVDEIKKNLLEYDLTMYPDLLIGIKYSADGDLYSFEFRKDEDTLFSTECNISGFSNVEEKRNEFIKSILKQL